MRKSSRR